MRVTKTLRLDQLETEATAAGIQVINGFVLIKDDLKFGNGSEPPPAMIPVINAHIAMRDITHEELVAQFLTLSPSNITQILNIIEQVIYLIPRSKVPM